MLLCVWANCLTGGSCAVFSLLSPEIVNPLQFSGYLLETVSVVLCR